MTTVEPDSMTTHPPQPEPPEPPAAKPPMRKNPVLAAVLSAFPGIGNLYNGLYMRGLAFFLICASLIFLIADHPGPLFGLAIPFFWIFNMVDAYRQAMLINAGYGQDLGIDEPPKLATGGQGGLMVGIILFAIGTIALLEQLDIAIDLDWLLDFWPVFLMAIGAWLIFDTVRERIKSKEEEDVSSEI